MSRIKLVGLCLVVVFAFGAVAVAQASAARYVYKVPCHKVSAANKGLGEYNEEGCKVLGGTLEWTKTLLAGEKEAIKSSMKSKEFVLKGKGVLNIESVTKCTSLELNAGEKPVIVGGTPGTSEKEKIEFKGCTATVGGSKCEKVEVENVSTSNEIVTVVKPEALKGRIATLFTPSVGEVFSKVKFVKCGIFGSQKAEVKGKSAGLDEPNGKEEVKNWLVYATGEKTEITEVEKSNKEKVKVELTNESKKATIEGEAWVELGNGGIWGVE